MTPIKIALLNSKGGVGKTTTSVNTGAALAELGHRTLLVDLDGQAHVSEHLGLEPSGKSSLDAVLRDRRGLLTSAILSSQYENLDVVLSTESLEDVEPLLYARNQPVDALSKAMRGLSAYRYVLFDCAPNLGILTRNAMRACDYLVIPTDFDSFSVKGMNRLGHRIAEMQEDYGETCSQVLGVLITKFDRRTSIENHENRVALEEAFGGDDIFFERKIRLDELCKRMKRLHHAVLENKESRAADDYRAFAHELLDRLGVAA